MRLTTKIFLGFLGFIFATILGFIAFLKAHEQDQYYQETITYSDELSIIDIDAYESIQVLNISDKFVGTITFADMPANQIKVTKDVLDQFQSKIEDNILYLQFNENWIDNSETDKHKLYKNVNIVLPKQDAIDLTLETNLFHLAVDSIEVQNIILKTTGTQNLSIKNSIIKNLVAKNIERNNNTATINSSIVNSQIETYTINDVYINYWNDVFESSHIGTLNIATYDENRFPIWNYDTLNWTPLNENAKFILEIEKASSLQVK